MKKILSLVVLAAAVAMVSCCGNTQKPAEAPACEACATCDKAAACEQAVESVEAAAAAVEAAAEAVEAATK